MKRIFTSILATAALLLLCTGLAMGQTLKVAGKTVSATGNVTGNGISGTVHYDATSKTLTLTNAKISTSGIGIEVSGTDTITVKTIAECEISSSSTALQVSSDGAALIVEVADKLTVNGYATAVSGKEREGTNRNVTFKSASGALGQVVVKGNTFGFRFIGVTCENVLMRCEALMGCFTECSALTLTKCIVTEPAGAAVSGSTVTLNNGRVADNLLIEPTQYAIRIAGNIITPQNRTNVTGTGILGGTISFDPESRTLLLDNAQVEELGVQSIWNLEIDNLTIALRGHSKLVSPNGTSIPVRLDKFTTIKAAEGENNPILEAHNGGKAGAMAYCAVWAHATTIISNCELRAYGAGGIMAQGADSLVLDNATIRAASLGTPSNQAERRVMLSMYNIKKLVLRGSNFTGPAEVWYKDGSPTYESQSYTGFATTRAGSVPTRDTVVIQPCHPVMVGGHYVLKAEADNIRHGVSAGKVSYNPATKTLTLDEATIAAGKGIGDQIATNMDIGVGAIGLDTLRIALKGENNIAYEGTNVLAYGAMGEVVEIMGTANDWLNVNDGIVAANKDLTLRGCNVMINNTLSASVLSSGVLRIDDAVLRAKGKDFMAKNRDMVIDTDSTEYVMLTSHSNTEVEFDSQGYLVKSGTADKVVDEWLVFEPCYGIEVNGVQVSRANCNDLRVIEGVTGSVSFSPAERVLRLNNASLSQLNFGLGGIRVSIEGNSTITATDKSAIETDIKIGSQTVAFEGVHGATLNIVATAAAVESGIVNNDEMTIKNLNLNINCDKQSAVSGSGMLIVQNSSVEITGPTSQGIIYGLGDLVLRCAEISAPYMAYFDDAKKAVVTTGGNIVKQGLTIVPQGTQGDTTATATASFTWYGTTYTASGDYEHTLSSPQGCDSVVTLHLTINAPTTYAISATASPAEGGSVSGAGIYTEGSTVTLTATPNSGYKFMRWAAGGIEVSTANPYTFECTDNRTLEAVFEKEQGSGEAATTYTISITASPAEGGSVSGAGTYTEGSSVTLAATSNSGYKFVRWIEGSTEVSTANPYTFTAQANRTLVGVFEKEQGSGESTGLRGAMFEALTLYPNPTSGELWITMPVFVEGTAPAEVRVYTASGQLVQRMPVHGASTGAASTATRSIRIDLSHLPSGIYVVRIGRAVAKAVRM